jgi:hypothetical protein
MPLIKLRDGSQAEVPSDPTPEEKAWIAANQAPSTAQDVGKSALSGVLEGVSRAPYIAGDLLNLGVRGVNKIWPGAINPEYEKLTSDRVMEVLKDEGGIYSHTPETRAGRYANAGANALGGAVLFGGGPAAATAHLPGTLNTVKAGLGRVLASPLAQAPVIGMAGELGGDLPRGFDESQPKNAVGSLAGSLAATLAGVATKRLLTPNAPAVVQAAAGSMTPEDWAATAANSARLRQAGATTATLADAVPPSSQLRGLTRDLSNAQGGSVLTQQLAGRADPVAGEIPRLLREAQETAHPSAVNVGQLGQQVGQAGQQAVDAARAARLAAYQPILNNAPLVPQADISRTLLKLKEQAANPQNLGTMDQRALEAAMLGIGKTPLYPMPLAPRVPGGGLPATVPPLANQAPGLGANLTALSKNVKEMRKGLPTGPVTLDREAGLKAYGIANEALKEGSPAYARAMAEYARLSDELVNPVRQGLPGQLSSLAGGAMTETGLPQVLARSSPEEVLRVLPGLVPDPAMRGQIARALLEAHPNTMTTAGQAATRTQGARQVAQGLVPPQAAQTIGDKTWAADQLAKLSAEAGLDSSARQQLGQTWLGWLQPFGETGRRSRLARNAKETEVLSELLGNNTENNLAILRAMARKPPEGDTLRAAIARAAAMQGAMTSNTGE